MKATSTRIKISAETVVSEHRPVFSAMFSPKSVALIGASEKPGGVGRAITENVQSFNGRVFLVNPSQQTILGQKTFSKVSDVPEPIDLAVIATPAATVPGIVAECAAVGVRGAVIISAGFKESGSAGAELEKQILERRRKMRIIGPNCVGVMLPHIGLNATFATRSRCRATSDSSVKAAHYARRFSIGADRSNSGLAHSFPSAPWRM
jgi:acetyltransferase